MPWWLEDREEVTYIKITVVRIIIMLTVSVLWGRASFLAFVATKGHRRRSRHPMVSREGQTISCALFSRHGKQRRGTKDKERRTKNEGRSVDEVCRGGGRGSTKKEEDEEEEDEERAYLSRTFIPLIPYIIPTTHHHQHTAPRTHTHMCGFCRV